MTPVDVFPLVDRRPRSFLVQARLLALASGDTRRSVRVHVLHTGALAPECEEGIGVLKSAGVDCSAESFSGGVNYMQKIRRAADTAERYAFKLDEDIWMGPGTWDFIVANRAVVEGAALTLSPVLSNGIPTCELFAEDFMNPADRTEVYSLFRSTRLGTHWKTDYSWLNDTIEAMPRHGWDAAAFYDSVARFNHHYKGIHPVRVNFAAAKRVNDSVLDGWDRLVDADPARMEVVSLRRPYLCNSAFVIRADRWKALLNDATLHRDGFDEVPLNLYAAREGARHAFVRRGFGVHTAYNVVNKHDYEREFIDRGLAMTG